MKKTENHLNLQFAGIADLFAYAERAKANGQNKASESVKRSSFNAFAGWEECQAAALKGWPEGLARVRALSEAFVSRVGSGMLKESFSPCETGLFFDVALVLSGEPEAWLEIVQTEEESKGSKLVTIGLNCSVSAAVSAEVVRQRGAAVLALVQLLEVSGRSVRVKVGIHAMEGGSSVSPTYSLKAAVVLKEWGEALDEDKLAFWLVCEDAFRRCFFRIMEACPLWKQLGAYAEDCYGMIGASWLPEGSDIGLEGLRSANLSEWNEAKAKAWIEGQLKAQGVILSE